MGVQRQWPEVAGTILFDTFFVGKKKSYFCVAHTIKKAFLDNYIFTKIDEKTQKDILRTLITFIFVLVIKFLDKI